MKVGVVVLLLVIYLSVANGRIFPRSGHSVQVSPKGQIPVVLHVPNFAQNVLISITVGEKVAMVDSLLLPLMKLVSTINITLSYTGVINIDDVASRNAIVISGLSREIQCFSVDSNTGVLKRKGDFTFHGTPITLGADQTSPTLNDHQLLFLVNSTLHLVTVADNLLLLVDTYTELLPVLGSEDFIIAGYSALFLGNVVLQIDNEQNYFAIYNAASGALVKKVAAANSSEDQFFVPTSNLTGFMFRTHRLSFDTGYYEVLPMNLLHGTVNGPKTVVPNLLFSSNLVFARGMFIFVVSINDTATYLSQFVLGDKQVLGVSHTKDNSAYDLCIGANDVYVFSPSEIRPSFGRPSFSLVRFDYNGAY